jgi:hypothetical protein
VLGECGAKEKVFTWRRRFSPWAGRARAGRGSPTGVEVGGGEVEVEAGMGGSMGYG